MTHHLDKSFSDSTYDSADLEQSLADIQTTGDDRGIPLRQVGISNLSLEYCDVMVETPSLRSNVFGSFDFDAPTVDFSVTANRDALLDPLAQSLVSVGLSSQPTLAEVRSVLDPLLDTLIAPCAGGTTCDGDRVKTIAKGTCAAVLGSAAVTVH